MTGAIVERITAFVSPDPKADVEIGEARRRAASGDASWAEWLDDLSLGRALICRFELNVELRVEEVVERVRCHAPGIWLEADRHPASVECQAQEAAAMMLAQLAGVLDQPARTRVPAARLVSMCVHVELDDAVRELLIAAPRGD
jgi:hypothetical protein